MRGLSHEETEMSDPKSNDEAKKGEKKESKLSLCQIFADPSKTCRGCPYEYRWNRSWTNPGCRLFEPPDQYFIETGRRNAR